MSAQFQKLAFESIKMAAVACIINPQSFSVQNRELDVRDPVYLRPQSLLKFEIGAAATGGGH